MAQGEAPGGPHQELAVAEAEPKVVEAPRFRDRPTEFVVRDAFLLGAIPLTLAGIAGAADFPRLGYVLLAITVLLIRYLALA